MNIFRRLELLLRLVAWAATFLLVLLFLLVMSPVTALNNPLRARGWGQHQLPGSIAFCYGARFLLWAAGISRRVVEADKASLAACNAGTVIVAYNHTSNLDPIVVQATCRNAPKFVYKKSLKYVPFLGWVLQLYHHVGIDRKNREKAIRSLDNAVEKMRRKGQSIAIAPEGTRSKSGQLQEFKKGPFHMAIKAKQARPDQPCLIVPVLIAGAYDLCPPGSKMFDAGTVDVAIRPPIEVRAGDTADTLLERVHAVFAREVPKLEKASAAARRPASAAATWAGPALLAVVGYGAWLWRQPS